MSKPMSEQMQKLADRYEKATGKKFGARTNADRIRAMSDEEIAESSAFRFCPSKMIGESCAFRKCKECWLEWLQQPAEEDDHDERKENENV